MTEQGPPAIDERLRAFVDHSLDALLLLDANGRITYATPSTGRHLNWNAADLIGTRVLDLVHPDDVAMLAPRLTAVPGAGAPSSSELRLRGADGAYRTIEAVAANRLSDPAVAAVIVHARAAGEQPRVETGLQHVEKTEAVARLAGGIAHDFNNLLTVILGYCTLLLEEWPAGAPGRQDLEEIRNAGDRAAILTHQLLALSRRQMMRPQSVTVGDAIRQAQGKLCVGPASPIEVVIVLAPDVPDIRVDPAALEEIVVTLAANACEAMRGGGRLTIESGLIEGDAIAPAPPAELPAGPYVMIAINDTGRPGLDASARASVFEPFFTTREQGRASGLGLATVHGLVKQNGGHIWVESEPGQGTTFRICFPVLDLEAVRAAALDARPGGVPETVLLIEPDEAVRTLGSDVLRRRGYAVLEAGNAVDGLRAAERHEGAIDLVVTALAMPQMTGHDLAHRIRQVRPEVKLLFVSGHADVHDESPGLPGEAFLRKPFTPAAMARTVRGLLDGPAPLRQN